MTPPPAILAALAILDADYEKVTTAIARFRDDSVACVIQTMDSFEAQSTLHRQRDQLANVRNNLRAYYDGRK